MPLYEYQCDQCGDVFSELRPSDEREAPIACPACGGVGKIVISGFATGSAASEPGPSGGCGSGPT